MLLSDQAGNPKLSDRRVEQAEPPTLYAQNHRILGVGRDLEKHVVQPLTQSKVCYEIRD